MSDSNPFTRRHLLSYVGMLLFFGAGIWFVLMYGARKHPPPPSAPAQVSDARAGTTDSSVATTFGKILRGNLRAPLSILLLQLAVIIVAARFFGMLFLKIDQPRVMGEIVAGIVLGPSMLGLLAPRTMEFLFPVSSMETLRLLSQVGVTLFMFIVGMDLSLAHLRKKAHTAIMVSHASIIVPFLMGAALSLMLYQTLSSGVTSFTAFALFMGIAMSITAFPVLARILEDRRMSQSSLGSMAVTCAAVDDVTAWCLLAVVIAIADAGEVTGSIITIALTLVFIFLMLFVIKPLLARLIKEHKEHGHGIFAAVLAFVFVCALVTETIGIHALFGAFLAGVVLPGNEGFRTQFKERLQTVSSVVLLPLFFAFSGLRMQINLLSDWYSWLLCAVIILVAITGKLGGSMLMARLVGMKWRDSFTLGVLLNTRGLIELIVLNIGYDLGILSAQTFAMMVLMALVTTFMTGPLLSLVRFGQSDSRAAAKAS